MLGNRTPAATSPGQSPATPTTPSSADDLIGWATDPSTGATDPRALANMLVNMFHRDPDAARQAYNDITQHLSCNLGDLNRFSQEFNTQLIESNATGSIKPDPGYWANVRGIATSDLPLGDRIGMIWDTTRSTDGMQGAGQVAGGVSELVAAGVIAGASDGMTLPLEIPIVIHGADEIATGLNRIFGDGDGRTVTYNAVNSVLGPWMADAVDRGIPFVAGVAATGSGFNMARDPWMVTPADRAAETTIGSADAIYSSKIPLETEFPELVGINPGYPNVPGTTTNCVLCVNAYMERMFGNIDAVATPGLPLDPVHVRVWGFSEASLSVDTAISRIRSLPNGSFGAAVIEQSGVDHVIGYLNRNGVATFIDTQSGHIVTLSPGVTVRIGESIHQ